MMKRPFLKTLPSVYWLPALVARAPRRDRFVQHVTDGARVPPPAAPEPPATEPVARGGYLHTPLPPPAESSACTRECAEPELWIIAQPPAESTDDDEQDVEEVIVSGSFIRRENFELPAVSQKLLHESQTSNSPGSDRVEVDVIFDAYVARQASVPPPAVAWRARNEMP